MKLEELLEPYKGLLNNPDVGKSLKEIGVNCISLVETWLSGKNVKSLKMELRTKDGELFKTLYGVNESNLTSEVFKICVEKPVDIASVKVYELRKNGFHIDSIELGSLDII